MYDLEARLFALEQLLAGRVQFDIQNLKNQVATLAQQQRQPGWAGGGGGGSSSKPFFFTPSASLAGPASVGSGSPGALTGQTLYSISGGAWSSPVTGATVYNGLAATLAAGKGAIAIQNDDGTDSAVAQSCT